MHIGKMATHESTTYPISRQQKAPWLNVHQHPSLRKKEGNICQKSHFSHNLIRDITADLLTEVCHSVSIEPTLQPLTGEQLQHRTANVEDGVCADISARGFWGNSLHFVILGCLNPHVPSCSNSSLPSLYKQHENEKRRAYQQRILEVEHGSFTPFVFSATGGVGPAAMMMYRRLAGLLAEKHNKPYSRTLEWILCALNFALLRSAIRCIRGPRSASHKADKSFSLSSPIKLAAKEGRIPCCWILH